MSDPSGKALRDPGAVDASGRWGTPPEWSLPDGVDRALWSYTHEQRLAEEEAAYFVGHPLLAADVPRVLEALEPASMVADLGCGTGRAAIALARAGHGVVAVDLARPMLERVARDARAERLAVLPVEANVCDLRGLASGPFDAVLLLFSTLGMIRGRGARRRALAEAACLTRPGGRLILHAHNLWHNLRNPAGRRWLIAHMPSILFGSERAGDRPMTYRGIPNLIVHQYRQGELRADLASAGWQVTFLMPLDAATAELVPHGRPLARWTCGGWLLHGRRTR